MIPLTYIRTLIVLIFIALPACMCSQNVDWLLHVYGISGSPLGPLTQQNSVRDAAGNIYLTSAIVDSMQFGPYAIHGSEFVPGVFLNAYYLAKLNPAGEPLWIKTFTGTGQLTIYDMAADQDGSVYFVGHLSGDIQVDTGMFVSNFSVGDMFLAKFDGMGDLQWVRMGDSQPGFSSSNGRTIDISPNGDVVVGGYTQNHVLFSGITIDEADNLFMASYTSDGDINWARSYGFADPLELHSDLKIDANNNIYWVGSTATNASSTVTTFDTISYDPGTNSSFLAKFDEDGDIQWLNSYGIDPAGFFSDVNATNLAVNRNNNRVSVAGTFTDTVTIGSTVLTEPYIVGDHLFVATFDEQGTPIWVKQSHGPADGVDVFDVALNGAGDVFIASSVASSTGLADFTVGEGGNVKSIVINGSPNGALVKYKANGELDWIKGTGGFRLCELRSVNPVGANTAIVTGIFTDSVQIGDSTLMSTPRAASGNIFIASCNDGIANGIFSPQQADHGLEVYPNPASDNIAIQLDPKVRIAQLRLLDSQGKVLEMIDHPSHSVLELSVETLPRGWYVVQTVGDKGVDAVKLLIQ
ncbi:MAG: T9SS type A sorting domain-containing protein [Bacteroidota bacterium]